MPTRPESFAAVPHGYPVAIADTRPARAWPHQHLCHSQQALAQFPGSEEAAREQTDQLSLALPSTLAPNGLPE